MKILLIILGFIEFIIRGVLLLALCLTFIGGFVLLIALDYNYVTMEELGKPWCWSYLEKMK